MVELSKPNDGAVQARLETLIASLGDQVSRLTASVDGFRQDMARLSVLEERHSTTNDALGRAFRAIDKAENAADLLEERVEKKLAEIDSKHRGYDKYLWLAVGFITCVSVVWSVVGYRINGSIDRANSAADQMRSHVAQDRILSSDDTRRVIREYHEAIDGR